MRRTNCLIGRSALWTALYLGAASVTRAQEMEPRAYAPSPTGMSFLTATVGQSSGGIAVDPSLPLDNVEATINTAVLGYLRTFGLLGGTASVGVGIPYAWGGATGDVAEERREARRSGLADARMRFAVNFAGAPALDRQEFAAAQHGTSLGASVTLAAPTGEYDSSQLVNLGANRWSVKPEIGLYQSLGAWSFEFMAGAWFFTDNDDFYGGVRREQDPVTALQAHVSYTFRRSLWVAADMTWYAGGRTTVDGVEKQDRQDASRVGLTASLPLGGQYSLKVAWSNGVTTRIGADFDSYAITVQRAW